MKSTSNVRSKLKELKKIPIWDQFYKVALNIAGPFLEMQHNNWYVLIAIDHYSKWCEVKAIVDHDVEIVIMFLEDEVICGFGVPKYVLTDNNF